MVRIARSEDRSTYATVGTVSAPALLGGLVDLDVLDDQVAGVETLGVGIGFGILEQTNQELSRLDGPAGLGDTESLACKKIISQLFYSKSDDAVEAMLLKFLLLLFLTLPTLMRCRISGSTHPEQCDQCCRHTASWEWPPCARGHFRGR